MQAIYNNTFFKNLINYSIVIISLFFFCTNKTLAASDNSKKLTIQGIAADIEAAIRKSPRMQEAVISSVDITAYGRCMALSIIIIPEELRGEKMSDQFKISQGINLASISWFRKNNLSRGYPSAYFDDALKPYSNMALQDRNSYIQENVPFCRDITNRISYLSKN